MRTAGFLVLLCALLHSPSLAEGTPTLRPGMRLRVTAPEQFKQALAGTFTADEPNTLVVQAGADRIAVRRGHRCRYRSGGALGRTAPPRPRRPRGEGHWPSVRILRKLPGFESRQVPRTRCRRMGACTRTRTRGRSQSIAAFDPFARVGGIAAFGDTKGVVSAQECS